MFWDRCHHLKVSARRPHRVVGRHHRRGRQCRYGSSFVVGSVAVLESERREREPIWGTEFSLRNADRRGLEGRPSSLICRMRPMKGSRPPFQRLLPMPPGSGCAVHCQCRQAPGGMRARAAGRVLSRLHVPHAFAQETPRPPARSGGAGVCRPESGRRCPSLATLIGTKAENMCWLHEPFPGKDGPSSTRPNPIERLNGEIKRPP